MFFSRAQEIALEKKGDLEAAFPDPPGAPARLLAPVRRAFLETLRSTSLADLSAPVPRP